MKFKSRVLLDKKVRDRLNASFMPVWADHPKVSKSPMEPILWEKTRIDDSSIICWVLEPNGSRVAAIRYQDMTTPEQLLSVLEQHSTTAPQNQK